MPIEPLQEDILRTKLFEKLKNSHDTNIELKNLCQKQQKMIQRMDRLIWKLHKRILLLEDDNFNPTIFKKKEIIKKCQSCDGKGCKECQKRGYIYG
jgi:hypothetical protein